MKVCVSGVRQCDRHTDTLARLWGLVDTQSTSRETGGGGETDRQTETETERQRPSLRERERQTERRRPKLNDDNNNKSAADDLPSPPPLGPQNGWQGWSQFFHLSDSPRHGREWDTRRGTCQWPCGHQVKIKTATRTAQVKRPGSGP